MIHSSAPPPLDAVAAAEKRRPHRAHRQQTPSPRRRSLAFYFGVLIAVYVTTTLIVYDAIQEYESHNDDDVPPDVISNATNDTGKGDELVSSRATDDYRTKNDFSFPSRDARIEYYMGDWHGRTLDREDIPCGEIKLRGRISRINRGKVSSPTLWSVRELERAVRGKRKGSADEWLIDAYLFYALRVLAKNGTNATVVTGSDDRRMILIIGDEHSQSVHLPVVAKTRFSRHAVSKKDGKPFFKPIIWPLAMMRHYESVDEYLKLEREGMVTPWEDKMASAIWRGGVTGVGGDKLLTANYPSEGWRVRTVKRYFGANVSDVDVAFQKDHPGLRWIKSNLGITKLVRSNDVSMQDQLKHKYLLIIEGNDVATGLKWAMMSNSVVFMSRPTCVSFLMEDILVPFVHYVPVKDDYSDLIEMVRWARENDDRCMWISEQATKYIERLWTSKEAREDNYAIRMQLGEAYHSQFGKAIKFCAETITTPALSHNSAFRNRVPQGRLPNPKRATNNRCSASPCFLRCTSKYGGNIEAWGRAYYCAKGCARMGSGKIVNECHFYDMSEPERFDACTGRCESPTLTATDVGDRSACKFGCEYWRGTKKSSV